MLISSANQGLVTVVLRFISRAIRTFHSADLAVARFTARAFGLKVLAFQPAWRNWQTRRTQNSTEIAFTRVLWISARTRGSSIHQC